MSGANICTGTNQTQPDVLDADCCTETSLCRGDTITPPFDMVEEKRATSRAPFHLRDITVEPLFLFFALGNGLRYTVYKTALFERVCSTSYNETVCGNLDTAAFKEFDDDVQRQTAQWDFYESIVFTLPASLMTQVYSSWSDRNSRKTVMLFGPYGTVLCSLIYLIVILRPEVGPGYFLFGTLIMSLTGSDLMNLSSGISYLTQVSPESSRTTRVAVAESIIILANCLAQFASGPLIRVTSYLVIFSISIALSFVAMLYVVLIIKDLPPKPISEDLRWERNEPEDGVQRHGCCVTPCKGVGKSPICTGVSTLVRPRTGRSRRHIIALMITLLLTSILLYAVPLLGYLFVRHPPLFWSPAMYGYFAGMYTGCQGLSLLVLLPLMRVVWKIQETVIMGIALVSGAAGALLLALSSHTWMVFIVPVVTMLAPAARICMRSLLSQLVNPNELGKLFGVVATVEIGSHMLSSALYSMVLYPATVGYFHGVAFILTAALLLVPIVITIWLHFDYKKEETISAVEMKY